MVSINPQRISIISTLANLSLGVLKVVFGLLSKSIALVADGIHSSLDVISSFATYLGLKTAQKPVDEKHPYGYWRAESLAGFLVTILLAISAIWIIYESIQRFLGEELVIFSRNAILVVLFSVIINEIMARLKFHYGEKYQSIALIADAKHSRADVLSSLAVLLGLLLVKYFPLADAIAGLLIGIYILWESFLMGKEITDSLLDVANKEVEERIKKICQRHQIEIADLKTRKIGNYNFAELKIKLPLKMKVEEVGELTKKLEERLLKNIPELKYIVISIEPYAMKRSVIKKFFGGQYCKEEGFEQIGPTKKGIRVIIPFENNQIAPKFGASQYLLIDIKDGKVVQKEVMKNPYFEKDAPRGSRFAKAVRADKVLTPQIGENARQSLENAGIEIELISPSSSIEDIIKKLISNQNYD